MNRLQRLDASRGLRGHAQRGRRGRPGPGAGPDDATTHPIYTPESVAAQRAAARAQRRHHRLRRAPTTAGVSTRTAAPSGPGRRGLARGAAGDDRRDRRPPAFALRRRGPARPRRRRCGTASATGTYLWLVDLDALPRLPAWPAAVRPTSGPPTTSATRGAASGRTWTGSWPRTASTWRAARVLMLAHARVLGHVFNPLTVYWCHRPDGGAGVRRRRGAQHLRAAALLPAAHRRGRAGPSAAKEFYVSPFFPVDGGYRMALPEPGERLAVTITLHRPDGTHVRRQRARPAAAGHRGRRCCVPPRRHPASTRRGQRPHPLAGRHGCRRAACPAAPAAARAPGRSPMSQITMTPAAGDRLAPGREPRPSTRAGGPMSRPSRIPACGPRSRRCCSAAVAARLPRAGGHARRAHVRRRRARLAGHATLHRPGVLPPASGAGGLIGFGESYMAGDWDCDDLAAC